MTYQARMQYVIDELGRHDVGAMTVAPPAIRLLWSLNVEAPPPLYMTLPQSLVYLGLPFGILMALTMGLFAAFLLPSVPTLMIVGICLLSGPLFGFLMHWKLQRMKSRKHLPSWEELERGYAEHAA